MTPIVDTGAAHPGGTPTIRAAEWRPPWRVVLAWAVAIGLLMSARLLFQPFVWRHWEWDEVVTAWFDGAVQHVAVALVIAGALLSAWAIPAASLRMRAALLASAVVVGATAAETTLQFLSGFDEQPVAGRLAMWAYEACCIAAIFYLWRRGEDLGAATHAQQLQRSRMEQQLTQLRLQALRSQIEPHFLFNTLATVRSLQGSDPRRGDRLLRHLLDYLDATGTSGAADRCTLAQEIALVRAYLGVVVLRMPERIGMRIAIPDELASCTIPPLVVATLVENAIKHGLSPKPEGGIVSVEARRIDNLLEIRVCDDGVGFSGQAGSGIGLANIRARLATNYGAQARLTLRARSSGGVVATVVLPMAAPRP